MKTIKKLTKLITALLITLMMLQSCTIYKGGYVRIDQAVQNENKVKINTKTNEKLKFKKVVLENGAYYGVKKVKGKNEKIPIDVDQIYRIKEKDALASTLMTVPTTIIAIFSVASLAFLIGGGGM